jgi:hypothetical protein
MIYEHGTATEFGIFSVGLAARYVFSSQPAHSAYLGVRVCYASSFGYNISEGEI